MIEVESGWRRTFYKLFISNANYGENDEMTLDNIVPARKLVDELIKDFAQRAKSGKMTKEVVDYYRQNNYKPVITPNAIQNVKFALYMFRRGEHSGSVVFQTSLKEFLEKQGIFLDCRWLETQYQTGKEYDGD